MPSSCPGQVDFPVGQVTFHSHLPNGQGPRQVICQLNCKKSNLRLSQGKQNLRATCPKGKLEFKFFSSCEYLCWMTPIKWLLVRFMLFVGGPSAAVRSAAVGAILLALIEGIGICITRMTAEQFKPGLTLIIILIIFWYLCFTPYNILLSLNGYQVLILLFIAF